jgi:putative aminopeptidase FrvX
MKRTLSRATIAVLATVLLVVGGAPAPAKEGGAPVPPMFPSGRMDPELLARLPKDVHVDSFGNAWVTRGSKGPHILFLTHRDAPGYVVSQITPDGFLRVQRIGTPVTPLFDQFMVGRRLLVYTRDRVLPAVAACPSTHFRRGGDVPIPEATVDDLWIDIGAESDREAEEMGVAMLDPVIPALRDPVFSTGGTERAGFAAGTRAAIDKVRNRMFATPPPDWIFTFAIVAGGTEGGRGSRRLLATIPRPDSVYVLEAVASDSSDSTLRVSGHSGRSVFVAPGDTAHAASVAWARRYGELHGGGSRALLSPDARVWANAGIPTLVLGWSLIDAGSPVERLPHKMDHFPEGYLPGVDSTAYGLSGWEKWSVDTVLWTDLHKGAWTVLVPLLRAYGVSEHERAVAAAVRAALPPGAKEASFVDSRGNVVLALGPGKPDRLFVAHQDEIGYRVTARDPDGRGRVVREGGFFDWLYEGELVRVSRPNMEYEATVPPRLGYRTGPRAAIPRPLSDELRGPAPAASRFEVGDVRIDPGVPSDSETPVMVGDDVTVLHDIARLGAHRLSARAIDDRYGCAALIMAAKELWPRRKSLPSTVWLVWSVEEEIGLKGAEWLADSLKKAGSLPERVHAVDTFVSSDSPLEDQRYGDAKLGQGAVVRAVDTSHEAPIEAVRATLALARREDIPLQYGVTSGGNDGVPFAERGSINVPLAWPLRYSHSAVEVADLRDLEALSRIIIALSKHPATSDPNLP